jgi:hypothetical protein
MTFMNSDKPDLEYTYIHRSFSGIGARFVTKMAEFIF